MDQFRDDDPTDGTDGTDGTTHSPESVPATPEEEAAALALAIVSQAAAISQGDEEALDASEDNLREVVSGLSDEPLTPRQEDVVATLGAAGGSLAAGLSEALAHTKGVDTSAVLGSAAEAVLAQTQPATRFVADDDQDAEAEADETPDRPSAADDRDGFDAFDGFGEHAEQRRGDDDRPA
jgi:hypothetical protein